MKVKTALTLLAAGAAVFPAYAAPDALALPLETHHTVKAAPTAVSHPRWSRDAVIYEVNWRQMTPEGTIKAMEAQLPRLKELGADILWIMPINPISEKGRKGELGSYYAASDYKAINPEMGDINDFRHFVREAHRLGMKVIIDWVPNHTGNDHWWTEYHPDYYVRDAQGNPVHPGDWTDVSKLDYSNPALRDAMLDAMAFWLREADIDGFRCDVAFQVPVDFWNWARPQLQALKPDLFMLAEASEPVLQEKAFDMAYNWPLAVLFKQIANNAGQYTFNADPNLGKKTASAIDSLLASQRGAYPADTYMMNMITNHDFNSWEGTEFQRLGNLADAMAVLTYTLPGMPMIYTGQETGLDRAFEFFKKDTPPTFEPRNRYFDFYRRLNELKHSQNALLAGEAGGVMKRYPTTSPDLYIFSRTLGDSEVLVAVNLGATTRKVKYQGEKPDVKGMTDWFSGAPGRLPSSLAPGEYRVYVRK